MFFRCRFQFQFQSRREREREREMWEILNSKDNEMDSDDERDIFQQVYPSSPSYFSPNTSSSRQNSLIRLNSNQSFERDLEREIERERERDKERERERDKEREREKEREKESEEDEISFQMSLLRDRLKRRSELVNEMRKGYLRDIIALKLFIQEILTEDERLHLFENWKTSIPSLDLRQHLMLYSPHETSLNLIPCESCGGSIEIVHHESSELEALSKALSTTDRNKRELKVIIGTKVAQLESLEKKWEVEKRKQFDEVAYVTPSSSPL